MQGVVKITDLGRAFLEDYTYTGDQEQWAHQQILLCCGEYEMTKEDFVNCFALPFPLNNEATRETRVLFDWSIVNMDDLLQKLLEKNFIIYC